MIKNKTMAKVTGPIKEVWDNLKDNKNAPVELTMKDDVTGIVRTKELKTKNKSRILKN